MRPPFPHVLDSTIVSAFRACPTLFRRAYLEHWKLQGKNVHLHAGAAFAHAQEATRRAFYEHQLPIPHALALGRTALESAYGNFQPPEKSAKTKERMLGAFDFYWENFPLDRDLATPHKLPSGKCTIEFSAAEPLPINHPETGDPLIYCGRFDTLMDFLGGLYVEDDKTTSSLGPSWAKSWDMRSQFTGYAWLAERAGFPIAGVIVRGISILKTKYGFEQAISPRSPHMIEQWHAQLLRDIRRMLVSWESGEWDMNLDESCTRFSGCSFQRACASPTPDAWISMNHIRKEWNPLTRVERLIEENKETSS